MHCSSLDTLYRYVIINMTSIYIYRKYNDIEYIYRTYDLYDVCMTIYLHTYSV